MNIKTLNITVITAGVALMGSLVVTTSALAKDSDFAKLVSNQEQRESNEPSVPVELRQKLSFEDSEVRNEKSVQITRGCLNHFTASPTQRGCNF